MSETIDVISKVRSALGRGRSLATPPVAPVIDEPVTRLVHSELGLAELFAKMAELNQMQPELVFVDELGGKLTSFLRHRNAHCIALPVSPMLEKIGVFEALRADGFHVTRWDAMTLDELYDYDAGVTDVYAAVAETGSLVVRASAGHGRALSLVPPIHVAIVEPKNFLPDLVDLFQKMTVDGVTNATSIITGPSRTADIEMSLVVGVHGPVAVKVFILT